MSYTYSVYRREKISSNPPVAIATGLINKSFIDDTVEEGKLYLYSVGASDGAVERVSSEIEVSTQIVYENNFKSTDGLTFFHDNPATITADPIQGGLVISSSGSFVCRFNNCPNMRDFIAEFDVTHSNYPTQDASLLLVSRTTFWSSQAGNLGYMLGLAQLRTYFCRGANSATNAETFITSTNITQSANVKYRVKIVASGNSFSIYRNNVRIGTYTNSTHNLSGGFGFRIYSPSQMATRLENLKIVKSS